MDIVVLPGSKSADVSQHFSFYRLVIHALAVMRVTFQSAPKVNIQNTPCVAK
jgi:hypothetical protein